LWLNNPALMLIHTNHIDTIQVYAYSIPYTQVVKIRRIAGALTAGGRGTRPTRFGGRDAIGTCPDQISARKC
jgi:hypothetical protein